MGKLNFAMLVGASLLSFTSLSLAAPATAVILNSTGKVFVNSGGGFQPAKPDSQLNPGFEVFIGENATATVHFNKGNCNVWLAAGSVTRITGSSLCQEAAATEAMPQGLRGLVDDVVVTPVNGYVAPPPPPVAPALISPYAIAGGILAVSATAFTVGVLEKDPVPPAPTSGP